ncbi:DUF4355 domain-containing protein [Clostridium botulinum]|uniref:DUF4355 domain-containing protein n=1 Tax=Clostridium TaxID=1485 RepID=UPI0013F76F17|nr:MULTISPECIES: DUF4355 domain-containing protein [Clostridium]MCS6131801.1 DUF4355 domain-containing protein [Clostridium botulinum]NFL45275.1 DUF4355 domain-containing protein [Clostridium botulinum]NFL89358.1 DUF4355 domain-containing protein [Clostridium botulinum]
MSEENQNVELENEEKSTDLVEENNSVGEITLEQFKNALENNLEVKGYYDSIVDKSVSKRLDKGIESWKEKNLENLIDEEISKRYPQKTEAEIKFEEQQKQLEQAMEDKRQLELQIKYQTIMAENNLPMEILDFVAGKDVETTISNIERFKSTTDTYIAKRVQDGIEERLRRNAYVPPSNDNNFGSYHSSMWD